MGKLSSFKLPIVGLSADTKTFKYQLDSEFFNAIEPTEIIESSIEVVMTVRKAHEGIYEFDFTFDGTATVPCDRCLEPLELPVAAEYHISVERGEEYDDSDDSVLVIPEAWQEIDVAPLMRDTVLLSLPMVHSHAEGDCDATMLRYMSGGEIEEDNSAEGQGDAPADPRWEALKKLKN